MRETLDKHPGVALELDLQRTADNEIVVFHDAKVDNLTDNRGPVRSFTYDQLRVMDPCYWWTPGAIFDHDATDFPLRGKARSDSTLRIPRLIDVLRAFPNTTISLDLKAGGMERTVAAILQETGTEDNVVVQSFSESRVQGFRRVAGRTATGGGVRRALWLSVAPQVGTSPDAGGHALVSPPERIGPLRLPKFVVDALHRKNLGVHVWTVNDLAMLDYLLKIGVDGIVTDVPSHIVPVVQEYNASLDLSDPGRDSLS